MSYPIETHTTQQNDDITPEDPTLGRCLQTVYGNSPNVPPAILKHFDNRYQLPAALVTPREESEITAAATPKEQYTSTQPASRTSPEPAPNPSPSTFNEFIQERINQNSPTGNHPFTFDSPSSLDFSTNQEPSPGGIRIQNPENFQTSPPIFQPSNSQLGQNSFHVPSASSNQPVSLSVSAVPDTNSTSMSIMPTPHTNDQRYSDITEFLNMPQNQAAKRLGIPPSTLSKRWREAAPNRKWPYRTVCKIDKEITTLLHNIPQDGVIPPDIEKKLSELIAKRQEELKTIVVRL